MGSVVNARPAKGPPCESSSAWDAGVRFWKSISCARSSVGMVATRCQPRSGSPGSSACAGAGPPASTLSHGGTLYPVARSAVTAWVAAWMVGIGTAWVSSWVRRVATSGARWWMAGNESHHDAQCAAKRCCAADRSPSPPRRPGSWAVAMDVSGMGSGLPVVSRARHLAIASSWLWAYPSVRCGGRIRNWYVLRALAQKRRRSHAVWRSCTPGMRSSRAVCCASVFCREVWM